MMTPNPAFPSRRSAVDYSVDAHMRSEAGYIDKGAPDKWPVWARLLIIVSLSALMWAGIIAGMVSLFG